jgi:hypothetical protein
MFEYTLTLILLFIVYAGLKLIQKFIEIVSVYIMANMPVTLQDPQTKADLEDLRAGCAKVYVFPDDEIYEEAPSWKSDDYEIRYQGFCNTCDSTIDPHWSEPFASCNCGTQEWYI